jgi:hypothetical protein
MVAAPAHWLKQFHIAPPRHVQPHRLWHPHLDDRGQPAHPYTKALLALVPRHRGDSLALWEEMHAPDQSG